MGLKPVRRAEPLPVPAYQSDLDALREEMTQLRSSVADRDTPTVIAASAPEPAPAEIAPEPVLFNPTLVWAPPVEVNRTDRTVLIVGALAVAVLLLLARKA
jgi:hypothetical protein